jgi:hypothetical protein
MKEHKYIKSRGILWLNIAYGFWYKFSLAGGAERYSFDFKKKEVTFYVDGTTRVNTSTWEQTGLGVANLLALKIPPEDEDDKSPCLSQFKNKFIHISSFLIN